MKVTILNNGGQPIFVGQPDETFPINPGKFAVVECSSTITLEEIESGDKPG